MTDVQISRREAAGDPAAVEDARPGAAPAARSGALGLLALVLFAAGVYVVLALRCPLPQLQPDEFLYLHTGRSLAEGTGMSWRGQHIGQSAPLYVFAIAPAWRFFTSTTSAYEASKVIGTLALCTTAVPVYVLARELMGGRRALLPAALSVMGTWMLASAMTLTEVVAYPLTTAALCTTVVALRRRAGRLGLLALGFALLATAARVQLVVIVFVVFGAFVVDVLLAAGHRRETARAHRTVLLAAGAVCLVITVGAVVAHGVAGEYSEVYGFRPSLSRIVSKSGLRWLEVVVSSGFVPVLLAAAASLGRRVWRDDRTRPLLIVFWLATGALVAQSGWYIASIPLIPTGIERYGSYVAPLAFVLVCVVALEPRLLPRGAFAVAAVLGLALLAMPSFAPMPIEPASWSTGHRVGGLTGLGHAPALALAALVAVGAAALAVRRRHALPALFAVVAVVLGVQSEAGWTKATHDTRDLRSHFAPDLQWFDHHTQGPAAVLRGVGESDGFLVNELFNRHLVATLQLETEKANLPTIGARCSYAVAESGELTSDCGAGATQPHEFVVTDPYAAATMYDELARAGDPYAGQALEVAPDRPARLRSFVFAACPLGLGPARGAQATLAHDQRCRGDYTVNLWLDEPGSISLRFQGGARTQTLRRGGRTWTLAPRRETTVRVPVRRGQSSIRLAVDWRRPAGTPRLVSASLRQASGAISLL